MDNSFIIEGISAVSAVINNTLNNYSNSNRRLSDVYFNIDKISKFDRTSYSRYKFLKENASTCSYIFHECTPEEFSTLVSGNTHGGIAAKCVSQQMEIIKPDKILPNSVYCCLDGIDDPYNLGYIIRTMYAFGVKGIILPPNNKMNLFPSTVIKSSAGITEKIDMYISSPENLCSSFKARNYKIVSTTLRDSIPCREADLSAPILIVIGGEKRGISGQLLSASDFCVRIDYSVPFNGSLPSVCAASIIGYEIGKQN